MKTTNISPHQYIKEKLQERHTLIVAHRGAKSLAPKENTLESFQIAIDLEVPMLEFDVRRTNDSVYIIHHDDSIDGIKISNLTYTELTNHANQNGFQIPLLSDALKLCAGKIKLDIDMKEPGYEKEVLDLILTYYSVEDFIIVSFYDMVIRTIKQLNPDVRAGLLLGIDHGSILTRFREFFPRKRLKKIKADFVAPHYFLATRALLHMCNKHGYGVYVWTVNKQKIYKKLLKRKVTAIVTDYPQYFRK